MRFENISTSNGGAYFFSLPGGGALADTGLPPPNSANATSILEVSLGGGNNGAYYSPAAGAIGGPQTAGASVTYGIVSDGTLATPEPSTFALLGVGASRAAGSPCVAPESELGKKRG